MKSLDINAALLYSFTFATYSRTVQHWGRHFMMAYVYRRCSNISALIVEWVLFLQR